MRSSATSGPLIVFRVGPFDAEVLETVFEPTFTPEDLVGLGIGQIYLTLMIDGVGSLPFSAETIPPIDPPPISYRDDCVSNSRAKYSRPRSEIEAIINKHQQDFAPQQKRTSPIAPATGANAAKAARLDRAWATAPHVRSGATRRSRRRQARQISYVPRCRGPNSAPPCARQ